MQLTVTDQEYRTLINALYTAAERYREAEATVKEAFPTHPKVSERLAAQFNKQAAEASALAQKLED